MTDTTTLTRRSLLRSGALAGLAALIGVRPWAAAPAVAASSHLVRSTYTGLIGEAFRVGSVALRLLSVSDVAGAAHARSLVGSEDAFVLTFSGPLEPALGAGIHELRNPRLGACALYLGPVGAPRSDRRYEAVVDRSVGAPRTPAGPAPRQSAPARTDAPAETAPKAARLLRRVSLRRTERGARADVLLARAANAQRVEARLVRRGRTVAVTARDVRERRAVLRFHGARTLPAGTYTLVLAIADGAGRVATRRRRVRLR